MKSCENCTHWMRDCKDVGTCQLSPPVIDYLAVANELRNGGHPLGDGTPMKDSGFPMFWAQPSTFASAYCASHSPDE